MSMLYGVVSSVLQSLKLLLEIKRARHPAVVCNAARINLFSQRAVDDLDGSKLAGSESQPLTRGCQLEATTMVRAIINNPDLKMGGPLNSRSLEQSSNTYTRGGLSGPGAPNGSCEQKTIDELRMRPPRSLKNVPKLSCTRLPMANPKSDSASESTVGCTSGLDGKPQHDEDMLAMLVGDETEESAEWECNETKNKRDGPFFPTPCGWPGRLPTRHTRIWTKPLYEDIKSDAG